MHVLFNLLVDRSTSLIWLRVSIWYKFVVSEFWSNLFYMQWLVFAKGSTVQQRASFQWEREGCTLFAWTSTSHCPHSVTSGLCLLKRVLFKIYESIIFLPLFRLIISLYSLQEKKLMHNIRQYKVPLQKYVAMMELQARISSHYK